MCPPNEEPSATLAVDLAWCSPGRTKQTAASAGLALLLRHMLRARCHIELVSFSSRVDVAGILGLAVKVGGWGEESSSGQLSRKKTTWSGEGGEGGARAVTPTGPRTQPREPSGASRTVWSVHPNHGFLHTHVRAAVGLAAGMDRTTAGCWRGSPRLRSSGATSRWAFCVYGEPDETRRLRQGVGGSPAVAAQHRQGLLCT